MSITAEIRSLHAWQRRIRRKVTTHLILSYNSIWKYAELCILRKQNLYTSKIIRINALPHLHPGSIFLLSYCQYVLNTFVMGGGDLFGRHGNYLRSVVCATIKRPRTDAGLQQVEQTSLNTWVTLNGNPLSEPCSAILMTSLLPFCNNCPVSRTGILLSSSG